MISFKREKQHKPLHKKSSSLEEKGLDFGEGQSSAGGVGRRERGESLLFSGSVDMNYMWQDKVCQARMYIEMPFGTENVGEFECVFSENFQTDVYRSRSYFWQSLFLCKGLKEFSLSSHKLPN